MQTCTENPPEVGRAGYSIFILLFQFLLPMITLIIAYYQGGGGITEFCSDKFVIWEPFENRQVWRFQSNEGSNFAKLQNCKVTMGPEGS